MINTSFRIKTFLLPDGKYIFCNCCFLFGEIIIGDYEQPVLAGTLRLSLEDLIHRLRDYELIHTDNHNLKEVFNSISDDVSMSCLPTFVEIFDGDFGMLCYVNKQEFLIIKKWRCMDLIKIEISRDEYIDLLINALKEIPNPIPNS